MRRMFIRTRRMPPGPLFPGKPPVFQEKGDLFAMIVAAFAVLWPIVLIVLVVLALAGYFFIVR